MGRIFSMVGAVAVLMVLLAGGGVYWLASMQIDSAKQESIDAVSKGASLSISAQIRQLNLILDNMAQSEELISAIDQGGSTRLKQVTDRFEKLLPGARKIRVLFPEKLDLDQTEEPHLGYADLDMVKETFNVNQNPVIQGNKGPNRHLAIARGIKKEDRVIAVILASLKYDFLKQSLRSSSFEDGLVELKQDKLVLAFYGDKSVNKDAQTELIKVSGTPWKIQSWAPDNSGYMDFTLLGAIVSIACLVVGFVSFIGLRLLGETLRKDQSSILNLRVKIFNILC